MPIIGYLVCFQYVAMKNSSEWSLWLILGHILNVTLGYSVEVELFGYRKYQIWRVWCRRQIPLLKCCPDSLLTSDVWLGCPLPLALLLLPLGSCYNPFHWSWWLGSQPEESGQKTKAKMAWQWNLSLGGFFSRFGKALKLDVGLEWTHPFLWLLPPTKGEPWCFGQRPCACEATFSSGHSCPQLLRGFLPRLSFCALLSSTSLPAFSLLWPFVSPELLANLHWSTVVKNTLRRRLCFGPRLPLLPVLTPYRLQITGIRVIFSSLPLRPYGHLWVGKESDFLVPFPCHPNMFFYGSGIWVSDFVSFYNQS